MFPNPFNVYLHDTPSRELFNRTERAFSSGCIRVQDPLKLAAYLLRDQKKYSLQEIQKIVSSNVPQTIVLTSKPQVFLLYLTSWVEDDVYHYRKDIYERDEMVYKALGEKPVYDIQ